MWGSSRKPLSSGFPTMSYIKQPGQLQSLAKIEISPVASLDTMH